MCATDPGRARARLGATPSTMPVYVDVITLRGTRGELDMFARNADGVHVPVGQLDPRTVPTRSSP